MISKSSFFFVRQTITSLASHYKSATETFIRGKDGGLCHFTFLHLRKILHGTTQKEKLIHVFQILLFFGQQMLSHLNIAVVFRSVVTIYVWLLKQKKLQNFTV